MDEYLTPQQVTELIPGLTTQGLATLRFRGQGPRFRKPSSRKVIYLKSEVLAWVESTARSGTAQEAS